MEGCGPTIPAERIGVSTEPTRLSPPRTMPKSSSYADHRQQGALNVAPRLSLSLFSKVEKNQIHHYHGSAGEAGLKIVLLAALPVLAREAVVHRRAIAKGVGKAIRAGRGLLGPRLVPRTEVLAAAASAPLAGPAEGRSEAVALGAPPAATEEREA